MVVLWLIRVHEFYDKIYSAYVYIFHVPIIYVVYKKKDNSLHSLFVKLLNRIYFIIYKMSRLFRFLTSVLNTRDEDPDPLIFGLPDSRLFFIGSGSYNKYMKLFSSLTKYNSDFFSPSELDPDPRKSSGSSSLLNTLPIYFNLQ